MLNLKNFEFYEDVNEWFYEGWSHYYINERTDNYPDYPYELTVESINENGDIDTRIFHYVTLSECIRKIEDYECDFEEMEGLK